MCIYDVRVYSFISVNHDAQIERRLGEKEPFPQSLWYSIYCICLFRYESDSFMNAGLYVRIVRRLRATIQNRPLDGFLFTIVYVVIYDGKAISFPATLTSIPTLYYLYMMATKTKECRRHRSENKKSLCF